MFDQVPHQHDMFPRDARGLLTPAHATPHTGIDATLNPAHTGPEEVKKQTVNGQGPLADSHHPDMTTTGGREMHRRANRSPRVDSHLPK